MDWWIWVLGGLVLLLAEVLTPGGFFVVFFGAGAILVGALKLVGWGGPAWAEWLVFTVLSVASLALFRDPLMRRFNLKGGKGSVDRMEGSGRSSPRTWPPAASARPRCAAPRGRRAAPRRCCWRAASAAGSSASRV